MLSARTGAVVVTVTLRSDLGVYPVYFYLARLADFHLV